MAAVALTKEKRVNICISSQDIDDVQAVLIRLSHPEKYCDELLPRGGTTLGISTPTAAHVISSEAISAFKWDSQFCGCDNRISTVQA